MKNKRISTPANNRARYLILVNNKAVAMQAKCNNK